MIREKNHRLDKELYRGTVSISFTLCIQDRIPAFTEPRIVNTFIDFLSAAAKKNYCIIPLYCFMPDHQHLILTGTNNQSDGLRTIIDYKQTTGYWFSKNQPDKRWQKDFYDHIIRKDEDLGVQARYILDNPVRKQIVTCWQDYPFNGSIGCDFEGILNRMM